MCVHGHFFKYIIIVFPLSFPAETGLAEGFGDNDSVMVRQLAMMIQAVVKVVSVTAMFAQNSTIQHQESMAMSQRVIDSIKALSSALSKRC